MLKRVLKLAGLGILLSNFVGVAIEIIISTMANGEFSIVSPRMVESIGGMGEAFLIQTLLLGVYGMLAFGGIALYDAERLPLAAATALHGALVIVPFIPVSLICGWTAGVVSVLIMAGCQLVGFVIIWLIMNAIYKKQVEELNELQEKFNNRK